MITNLLERLNGKVPSGSKRSSAWPGVRKHHLATNPACVLCGGTDAVEVHHRMPFHLKPELELSLANLVTLCESKKGGINCHLAFGHLGNFKQYNPTVDADCAAWAAKIADAPTDVPDDEPVAA